jgi:hypothetical protein
MDLPIFFATPMRRAFSHIVRGASVTPADALIRSEICWGTSARRVGREFGLLPCNTFFQRKHRYAVGKVADNVVDASSVVVALVRRYWKAISAFWRGQACRASRITTQNQQKCACRDYG